MSYEMEAKAALKKIDDRFKKLEGEINGLAESRKILISYGEILKGHYLDVAALDKSFHALCQALEKDHPDLQKNYLETGALAAAKENPAMRERLQQLDALIQKLKGS